MVLFYLGYWRVELRRRNLQSWESLVVRLDPAWGEAGVGISKGPAEMSSQSARGLWLMHRDAGIMLQIANFAERNGVESVDPESLEALRRDAIQIRICVVKRLVRRISPQWSH